MKGRDLPPAWRTHADLMEEQRVEAERIAPWREILEAAFEKTKLLRSRRGNVHSRTAAQVEATQLLRDFVNARTRLLIPLRPNPFDISILEARQFFAGRVAGEVSGEAIKYYTNRPEGRGALGFATPSRPPTGPLAQGYWELLGVAELVDARGITPIVYAELVAPFPGSTGNDFGFLGVSEVVPTEGAEIVTRTQLAESDFFAAN